MTGAEALIQTLLVGGVDTCFTNPGTSEIHLVAALDKKPETRCVLGLFEGVVTGAADGYARIAEKPAWTLLHLGPGFANGIANLHNASRADTPIINVVGQHATYHLRHDTPLVSDIESIARPYSRWLRTSLSASQLGCDAAEALTAARSAPGNISTLVVPADVAWSGGGVLPRLPELPRTPAPPPRTVEQAAAMLRSGLRSALLLSGDALYGRGLKAAGEIAAATGAKLFAPYPFRRLQRGAGLPAVERVHYILEQAKEQWSDFRQLILLGAKPPVAYFAYQGKDSRITSDQCEIFTLAGRGEDYVLALEALADSLSLPAKHRAILQENRPAIPTGEVTLSGLAAAIGALLPENAIVIDESMTSGRGIMAATSTAPPHDWLANTGGSIGIALPLALGAAIAAPERRVLCLSADGSGMYTLQALWSMAREAAKVTTVIFANRAYAVLKREFSYLGIGNPGQKALDMFDLGRPDLDWVHLANGLGVPGRRVTSLDEFANALAAGFKSQGPMLIEVPL